MTAITNAFATSFRMPLPHPYVVCLYLQTETFISCYSKTSDCILPKGQKRRCKKKHRRSSDRVELVRTTPTHCFLFNFKQIVKAFSWVSPLFYVSNSLPPKPPTQLLEETPRLPQARGKCRHIPSQRPHGAGQGFQQDPTSTIPL